jgi:GNAT superfamily N-acetyltransferase
LDLKAIRVEVLGAEHDRSAFCCGVPALDRYLREQAGQDARRRVAAPFVATGDGRRVLGFYTLSATSIQLTEVPEPLARKLPRYPRLPATLLGRLATDLSARGVGLGRFLLVDAMVRAVRSEIASFALVLDAKDETAASFYEREGFIRLPGQPIRLLRRMDDLAAVVGPA